MNQTFTPPSPWSQLRDSRILIVGGSSGIGLGGARFLSGFGTEIIIAGRSPQKIAEALPTIHGRSSGEIVDGCSQESIDALFERVGPFDHLIITLAGRLGGGRFADTNLAEFRQAFEEKFWPHLRIAQASLKTISTNGSLTFVTGASARKVSAGGSGFAAMNGALEIMTPTLARELAPLRVNAVSPGFVVTPWYDNISEADLNEAASFAAGRLPVQRVGTPEDVAQALLYVVSNGFVTGSVIECDGGARVSNDMPEEGLPK